MDMRKPPDDRVTTTAVHVPVLLTRVTEYIERQSRPVVVLLCVLLLLVVFAIDAATGPQFSFSIFYLLPVGIAAWHLGWHVGLITVAVSGVAWLAADRLAGQVYVIPAVQYWNALVRAAFFFIVAWILTLLKDALIAERAVARTDVLTGLANKRSLTELGDREVGRAHRLKRPITLAYLDVDGFKNVNDTQGHAAGDELLCAIADSLRQETRDLDVVARVGGDEFALLLTDASPAGARVVMERVLRRLEESATRGGWHVAFSIGVISADHPAVTLGGLLRQADHLMYDAKRAGGSRVAYRDDTTAGPDPRAPGGGPPAG